MVEQRRRERLRARPRGFRFVGFAAILGGLLALESQTALGLGMVSVGVVLLLIGVIRAKRRSSN
jgi:hypothetical protein